MQDIKERIKAVRTLEKAIDENCDKRGFTGFIDLDYDDYKEMCAIIDESCALEDKYFPKNDVSTTLAEVLAREKELAESLKMLQYNVHLYLHGIRTKDILADANNSAEATLQSLGIQE